MKTIIASLLFLLSSALYSAHACNGGTFKSNLSATSVYQGVAVKNGEYFTMNVTMCNVYTFTFCKDDSSIASLSWDAEITILNADGSQELGYQDDFGCEKIVWTAPFTGTIRILISKWSCNHNQNSSATLAYKMINNTTDYCLFNDAKTFLNAGRMYRINASRKWKNGVCME